MDPNSTTAVLFGGFVSYQGHSAMILKLIPIILYDVWL
jgi:hypothetical protein